MRDYKFEDFLVEEVFPKVSEGILDDDLPDAFDNWISNLDVDEVMQYAELFAVKLSTMHLYDMRERLQSHSISAPSNNPASSSNS